MNKEFMLGLVTGLVIYGAIAYTQAQTTPEIVMPEDKTCVVEIKYSQIKATHVHKGYKK